MSVLSHHVDVEPGVLTLKALIDALLQLPQLIHHHQLLLQVRDLLPVQTVLGEIQTIYNVKVKCKYLY